MQASSTSIHLGTSLSRIPALYVVISSGRVGHIRHLSKHHRFYLFIHPEGATGTQYALSRTVQSQRLFVFVIVVVTSLFLENPQRHLSYVTPLTMKHKLPCSTNVFIISSFFFNLCLNLFPLRFACVTVVVVMAMVVLLLLMICTS